MRRIRFPFDKSKIPSDGIYILFEDGESSHGSDRIVRIGTHTGEGQLASRLTQHFLNENKDRSVFRKNIGRAILNKDQDPFLDQWNLDLTTREMKKKHSTSIDFSKQKDIEKQVTDYIQKTFSFVVIQVDDMKERMQLESKLISTVSLCEECKQSDKWLGNSSPLEKIRESGLWLVNELYKQPLTQMEVSELHTNLSSNHVS